jgi:type III secretory pathway lipoprotein EscJ
MNVDKLPDASGTEISPYRMAQLVKVSSKITDLMVSSIWQLSYDELNIVLDLVRMAAERSHEGR